MAPPSTLKIHTNTYRQNSFVCKSLRFFHMSGASLEARLPRSKKDGAFECNSGKVTTVRRMRGYSICKTMNHS